MGCGGSKAEDAASASNKSDLGLEPSVVSLEEDTQGPLSRAEINARIIGSKEAQSFALGATSGFVLRYAALSQRGYYPSDLYKANQDRYIITPKFNGRDDQILLGVFDGHGNEGDACSNYVKSHIVNELKRQMEREKHKFDFKRAYLQTFLTLDDQMHTSENFDDSWSGTTAITALFKGDIMHIANIGDSRAVLGERHGTRVIGYALSVDQTPYRKDERERVKACGARVMTSGMADGHVKYYEGWEDKINDLDGGEDPPRAYIMDGSHATGGNAFTRSLGDSCTSKFSTADAELVQMKLSEQHQFVVLASDGVWEFITTQGVVDTVMNFTDPVDACRTIVAEAYGLWLQFDVRTDDITIILAYIDMPDGPAPRKASDKEIAAYDASIKMGRRLSQGMAQGLDLGLSVVAAGGEARPVRRGLSEEKRQNLGMTGDVEDDDLPAPGEEQWEMKVVPKTDEEVAQIRAALKGNFLFQNLPDRQTRMIFDVMTRQKVGSKEVVIKQGDVGKDFYILDEGELVVSIESNGVDVEIMRYCASTHGANPCFGELALMYSKPRAATVTAVTDSKLWAIDRRSFREILKKSSNKYLMRTLRSVAVLKSLSVGQLQRLSELLVEVTYKPGDSVIKQGEEGDTFYILQQGIAKVLKNMASGHPREVGEIISGQYFGERALLHHEPRAANVVAGDAPLKCLCISKGAFEEVLGPLQDIINADTEWRYKVAYVKALRKKAAGLNNCQPADFTLHGSVATVKPMTYMLASFRKKQYTLRVLSKKQLDEMGLHTRLRNEMRLLTTLTGHKRLMPLSLHVLEDQSYIYAVYPIRIACTIQQLLEAEESHCFDETTTCFFAATIVAALEHLHAQMSATGGVLFRNLVPAGIAVDEHGYPQLIDMRYAVTAEPVPRDYCGFAHYLAPEQVTGLGHGRAVDFWALGLLTYEMLTHSNPWLTGDPAKDSEVAVFSRISAHTSGTLQFPADLQISPTLAKFLNELVEPDPEKRLGATSEGFKALRGHGLFDEVMWPELIEGNIESPCMARCSELVESCIHATAEMTQEDIRNVYLDEVYEGQELKGRSVANEVSRASVFAKPKAKKIVEVMRKSRASVKQSVRRASQEIRRKSVTRRISEELDEEEVDAAPVRRKSMSQRLADAVIPVPIRRKSMTRPASESQSPADASRLQRLEAINDGGSPGSSFGKSGKGHRSQKVEDDEDAGASSFTKPKDKGARRVSIKLMSTPSLALDDPSFKRPAANTSVLTAAGEEPKVLDISVEMGLSVGEGAANVPSKAADGMLDGDAPEKDIVSGVFSFVKNMTDRVGTKEQPKIQQFSSPAKVDDRKGNAHPNRVDM